MRCFPKQLRWKRFRIFRNTSSSNTLPKLRMSKQWKPKRTAPTDALELREECGRRSEQAEPTTLFVPLVSPRMLMHKQHLGLVAVYTPRIRPSDQTISQTASLIPQN